MECRLGLLGLFRAVCNCCLCTANTWCWLHTYIYNSWLYGIWNWASLGPFTSNCARSVSKYGSVLNTFPVMTKHPHQNITLGLWQNHNTFCWFQHVNKGLNKTAVWIIYNVSNISSVRKVVTLCTGGQINWNAGWNHILAVYVVGHNIKKKKLVLISHVFLC